MKIKNIQRFKIILFLSLSIISIFIVYFTHLFFHSTTNFSRQSENFQKTFLEKEKVLDENLLLLKKQIEAKKINNSDFDHKYFSDLFEKGGILFQIYKKDSLIFWTSNSVSINNLNPTNKYDSVCQLKNGWYYLKSLKLNEYNIIGFSLIKSEYKYQNDYLVNGFQQDFELSNKSQIVSPGNGNIVKNSKGAPLFGLKFSKTPYNKDSFKLLLLVFYILSLLFIISFIRLFIGSLKLFKNQLLRLSVTLLVLWVLRAFLFYFKVPHFIYDLDFFGPKYFATSDLLPSLGDLLLYGIFIFFSALEIFKINTDFKFLHPKQLPLKVLVIVLSFSLCYFLSMSVIYFFKSIIINSNVSFLLNNIFGLTVYSYLGLVIIVFLFISLFLVIIKLLELVFSNEVSKSFYFLCFVFSAAEFFVLYYYKVGLFDNVYFFLFTTMFLFLLVFRHKNIKEKSYNFSFLIIALIFFSFVTTYGLYKYNNFKEEEKRKLLAIKLTTEQDPIAEYLFNEIESNVLEDSLTLKLLSKKVINEDSVLKRLQVKFFNGYWSKYDMQITICKPGDTITIKPDNYKTDCDDFFNNIIKNIGRPTLSENMFFLNNESGRNSYLSRFVYYENPYAAKPIATLYLELDSKFIPKELGYPELLIDKSILVNKDLTNYSYARYKNGEQINQYGKYFYNLTTDVITNSSQEFLFFDKNNYSHLQYQVDDKHIIIISKKNDSVLDIIAPFSYLFILYVLISIIVLFLYIFPLKLNNLFLNFKGRLQAAMIFIVVVSFIIIGTTTVYYIINIYNNKNTDNISEKAHSILVEAESKLSFYDKLTPDMRDFLNGLLINFSNVYFTDINLYDLNGNILASSREKIFEEGLVSNKMNSEAYNELTNNKKTLIIINENIGKLNYSSVYIPLRNNQNKLTSYLNMPYFSKQSELKNEISGFLIAFINVYMLLIALAIIIAILLSNYITRPLKFIKDKMSRISLGKSNEKIVWKSKDEIGSLINEYNRMIDELSHNAELLAQSEREGAWSEMAKQVAHEIKNPLTPMKLSVQHLQRAWIDKAEDWDSRLERFTKTMIEQIESLSSIASEFSDFAKLSKMNFETIDLVNLIESIVTLNKSDENFNINFSRENINEAVVFADKSQMLRVFNNLIKNAIQAIENNEKGKIEITITKMDEFFQITISDNGVGIDQEQFEKIFSPNFTTKTGGMGLGLAMVKGIIENLKGKIWFESEKNIGTKFIFTLPQYIDDTTSL
ncbi:MAG: GHKL domain-containing protein [Bacteroidetes bacterium]|nr:GHKL domain-containing protein [Bacteroidota bacterium]